MIYYHTMFGISHPINSNEIPMGMSFAIPTFCNQNLLEIASNNNSLFSLCVAWTKFGSCVDDGYWLLVGKREVDMLGIGVLLKL